MPTVPYPAAGHRNCVHFADPGGPPGVLRDLLARRVEMVPAGGEIDWATYYFRDRKLARALVRAHQRGVRVRVTLEGRPRLAHANAQVLRILGAADGIGDGLSVVRGRMPASWPRARLHAKIYCFSHPHPAVFIGSFNPSGDTREDRAVMASIGDQDRGYNTLVELADPALVLAMARHVRDLHGAGMRRLWRCGAPANRVLRHGGATVYFFPRLRHRLIRREIDALGAGDRLRIAASHIKAGGLLRALCRARQRGAEIGIVTHDTERRAPGSGIQQLQEHGAQVRRCGAHARLPMHNKFILVERRARRWVYFGSLNLNMQSQLLNHEVLVRHQDPELFGAFQRCWQQMYAAAG